MTSTCGDVRRARRRGPRGPQAREQAELLPDPLFDDEFDGLPDRLVGYRGPTACQAVGHHLPPARLLGPHRAGRAVASAAPPARAASGCTGFQRHPRPQGRQAAARRRGLAAEHPRRRRAPAPPRVDDLAGITLFSDGATVYECTSAEEVVDLLQGGQGVFGIAVGGAMREIERLDRASCPMRARRRRHRSTTRPEDELSAPAGAAARPADRRLAHRARTRGRLAQSPDCATSDVARRGLGWRAVDDPARESPDAARAAGRRRSNPPRNLSGPRTARVRHLWKATAAQQPPPPTGKAGQHLGR